MSVSCLLVRAALFAELNGFDPDYDDEAIDLDLCWRARVVDGPVLVVPEARARVRAGALATASTAVSVRNRLRTMIKCYSFFRLAASRGRDVADRRAAWRDEVERVWRSFTSHTG